MIDFTKSNFQHKWVTKIQTKNRQRQTQRFCRRNAKPWKKTLRIPSSFVVMLMSSPLRSTYDYYHRYHQHNITWFSPFWRVCHSTNDRALTATSRCIWTWRKGDVYGAFTNLDIFKWLNILFDWVYRTDATGQLFQKVENDENRFFAITSSKLVTNWFCKKHLLRNDICHNYCFLYVL